MFRNLKSRIVFTSKWGFVFVLALGLISMVTLSVAVAAAASFFEAETGILNGAVTKKNDSTASGGSYILFNTDTQAYDPNWVGCTNNMTVSPPTTGNNVPVLYTGNEYRDLCPDGKEAIPEDNIVIVAESLPLGNNLGQKLFTINCDPTHYLEEDPIVFPGRNSPPPVTHMHEFFGAQDIRGNSSMLDIVSKPNSCSVQADRSAYWTPAVYQGTKRIPATSNKFYYKVGQLNPNTTQFEQMPFGLRMIAGKATATSSCDIIPQSGSWYKYPFQVNSPKVTHPHLATTSRCGKMFSLSSNPGVSTLNPKGLPEKLQLEIVFPQCWDGKHLWLPNTAHMTYANSGKCPASHPRPLMQVQYNLGYHGVTDTTNLSLSSGEWYTFHADFINGWRPETLRKLTEACPFNPDSIGYGPGRYCGIAGSGKTPCSRSAASRGCIEILPGKEPVYYGTPREGAANDELQSERNP